MDRGGDEPEGHSLTAEVKKSGCGECKHTCKTMSDFLKSLFTLQKEKTRIPGCEIQPMKIRSS